jgi:hypothetical protein
MLALLLKGPTSLLSKTRQNSQRKGHIGERLDQTEEELPGPFPVMKMMQLCFSLPRCSIKGEL